jgi:hypothetical protein
MFGGVVLSSRFGGEGAPPDIGLVYDGLTPLTGSASFSLQFGAGFPCDFSSSVTVTVQVERPSPSADALVIASIGTWTAPKPDTFSPSRKASLSHAWANRSRVEPPLNGVLRCESRKRTFADHQLGPSGLAVTT